MDRLAVVYVAAMSDSVGATGREAELAYIRASLEGRREGDLAGVVAFGGDALVERLPNELRDIDRLASTPVRDATDIGAALRLASALFPDDVQKRIVLLSDGNDTTGSGETEASLAAARGIQVTTVASGLGAQDEALVERLTAPSTAHVGDKIELSATITSTVVQDATARLFVNGEMVASQPVHLEASTTTVRFIFTAKDAGFLRFRVALEAPRDTFDQNNRADASTIVKGPPKVLVVQGNADVGGQLVAALKAAQQNVQAIVPEALPADLTALADFDSIVLVDVPKVRLPDKAMEALQVYVRDLGRGLVAVGGPNTYGAGGLANTPLEEALPVDMGVKDKTKQPDIALVVVIDKSGSMDACHCNSFGNGTAGGGIGIAGVRKVDIGKEAILRAAGALTARDQLGVVAFDDSAHWVVKTSPLGGITDLQGQIAPIAPNGSTNIFSGLQQAVQSLEGTTATRRHIILLTDGWSSSGQYDQILAQMKADGITLSTVGAGGGANPFLEQLANRGGGRYYPAANPASIPDIFLKETQQVSGQQIVEEPFYPVLTSHSPIIDKLGDTAKAFPQLLGYDGTTAKAAAQTVLVTARDDPLLAQWQYGLGRSVAWTSDATGRWAKSWIGWSGFSPFFANLVAWTFPGEESGGIDASFTERGGREYLRVESTNPDRSPRDFYATSAVLVGPDLTPATVPLSQVAPGVYEAPLASLQSGAYAVRVTQTRRARSRLVGPSGSSRRSRPSTAAGHECRAARDAARGHGRARARDAARRLDARSGGHVAHDAALAVAADPCAAALADRRGAPARVDRPPGARRRPGLAPRRAPQDRLAHRGGGGPARRPRAHHGDAGSDRADGLARGRGHGRAGRRRAGARRHPRSADARAHGAPDSSGLDPTPACPGRAAPVGCHARAEAARWRDPATARSRRHPSAAEGFRRRGQR
ncbi:MAG: VWA domain-containing protein [Chloroflexota bacterium]